MRPIVRAVLWCCLLFAANRCTAFQLTSLAFQGNQRESSASLLKAALTVETALERVYPTRSELLLTVQKIEENVRGYYVQHGYYFASVDSFKLQPISIADSMQYTLVLFVQEGSQYKLHAITITGNRALPLDTLTSAIETPIGAVLDESQLDRDIAHLLQLYESRGYPLAQIHINAVETIADTALVIHLQVQEGVRARIGNILVRGNTSTSPEVITRELRLPVGSYYSAEEFAAARERVEKLGYFESVEEPEVYLVNDSTLTLIVRVREGSTSTIDGILGYNPPRTTSESGYITGFVDLSFRNISGTGRDGALRYTHEDPQSQELEVRYREPWIFGYPVHIGLGYDQRQQDTTYVRTVMNADVTFLLNERVSAIGGVQLERVIPTDLPDMPFTVFNSQTLTTSLTARYDSRDNTLSPHHGGLLNLTGSYGKKDLNGPARFLDSTISRTQGISSLLMDGWLFLPLPSARFVLAAGAHAGAVHAAELDNSDLFRLGGFLTIRGYRENTFLVDQYLYSNIEYRVLTGKNSFLFAFTDLGYLDREPVRGGNDRLIYHPWSYGIGIQIESALGLISASVARANEEPIEQSKLHLGLVRQF